MKATFSLLFDQMYILHWWTANHLQLDVQEQTEGLIKTLPKNKSGKKEKEYPSLTIEYTS